MTSLSCYANDLPYFGRTAPKLLLLARGVIGATGEAGRLAGWPEGCEVWEVGAGVQRRARAADALSAPSLLPSTRQCRPTLASSRPLPLHSHDRFVRSAGPTAAGRFGEGWGKHEGRQQLGREAGKQGVHNYVGRHCPAALPLCRCPPAHPTPPTPHTFPLLQTVIFYCSPALTALLAWLLLGEAFGPLTALGCATSLAGEAARRAPPAEAADLLLLIWPLPAAPLLLLPSRYAAASGSRTPLQGPSSGSLPQAWCWLRSRRGWQAARLWSGAGSGCGAPSLGSRVLRWRRGGTSAYGSSASGSTR